MNDYIKKIINEMKREKSYFGKDSLSVEEVLKLSSLKDYKLLAGAKGLNNRCEHITILETPTGMDWLEGREFLVTAGYAFINNEEYKKNMIINANKRGVSAIAIKENRYFGEISKDLIEQANNFSIPLIQLPFDVIYTRTVSSFYDMLFYRKNEYILSLNNIYEKFLDLSFENKNIDEMVYSLSNLSNSNVFLFDNQFNLISKNIINKFNLDELYKFKPFNKDGISMMIGFNNYIVNYNLKNIFISVYPILGKEEKVAFVFIATNNKIDKLTQSTIEYGISIISVKLEQNRAAKLAQTGFNKTLVEIMLHNKGLPDEFYENVENDLGWDSDGCIVGICIRLHLTSEQNIEKFKIDIFNGLKRLFDDRNYLYTDKKKEMFLFIKIQSEDYLDNLIVNLFNYLKLFKDSFIISLGVANTYKSIKNIEQLYNESYLAALFSTQEVIYFNSLDTIKLLYPLKEDKEIQEYYKKTIKKLEKYDEEHGGNLIETLEAYLKYNLKKTTVAEKLFIHVETLRYRLNRIEEITGYSLDDSEGLFALQMGIKLKRLVKIT